MDQKTRQDKFEEFFKAMYPKVKNFAARLLYSEDDAEDIAQDIFVKLWDKPESWSDKENWSSYIFTITRNRVLDFLRHKAIKERFQNKNTEWLNPKTDTGDIVSEKLYAKEIEILSMMVIRNMPEQRQKVFCMSRADHLSNAEIAERLGLSIRTVERHIHLAIKDIRKALIILTIIFLQH